VISPRICHQLEGAALLRVLDRPGGKPPIEGLLAMKDVYFRTEVTSLGLYLTFTCEPDERFQPLTVPILQSFFALGVDAMTVTVTGEGLGNDVVLGPVTGEDAVRGYLARLASYWGVKV